MIVATIPRPGGSCATAAAWAVSERVFFTAISPSCRWRCHRRHRFARRANPADHDDGRHVGAILPAPVL